MKHVYLKICRLLAASGFRENELAEFADQVSLHGPEAFLSFISELRRFDSNSASQRFFIDLPSGGSTMSPSDAAVKIERLLLHDAGMPRALAIEMLTSELSRRFPMLEIPSESRKGFGNWIRRLSQNIPEKDLLFVATGIRNRLVHDAPTDWRLK